MNKSIYLHRQGASWRMETPMFAVFINHLNIYFKRSAPFVSFENVLYAEISDQDLQVLGPIFGGHFLDDSKILLVPIFPENYLISRKECIHLTLTDKNSEEKALIHLKCH